MKCVLFIFINIFLANGFQSSIGFCAKNLSFQDCKTIKENDIDMIDINNYKLSNGKVIKIINNQILYDNY